LTIATIYDKKSKKLVSKEHIEIDLVDLENYGNFRHAAEFVKFPSQKIDGKTILEWFEVDGTSYWWFAAPILHPKYNEAVLFINRLLSFIEEKSIKSIKLRGIFEKTKLIKQITKEKNIKLEISREYYSYLAKNRVKNLAKKSIHKTILNEKIKKRNEVYRQAKNFGKPSKDSIIITSPGIYRRQTFDFETNKSKKEEFFIKPFLDILSEKKIPTICFDLDYTLRGTLETLEERLQTDFNWIPIEIFLEDHKSNKTQKNITSLKNSITNLLKKDLSNLLTYHNISLAEYLKQSFKDLFLEPNLPTYIHLVDKLEEYFKTIHPKAIIQVYETGTYAKAFEVVAKKMGIRTLGIQHGLIPTDYPDYMFKETRNATFPLGNPIPDLTLVYGNYSKKILSEIGSYPKEKIRIIGNPTYFDFDKIKKLLDKKTILNKNNLEDKKIVLVPLSMRLFYLKNSPDRILLNTLYDGFKDQDDIIILIRPHPGDKLDQKILTNFYPGNNFKISKNTLFEDIFVSDMVVILPISSVSSEVPMFEKPLILVNIEKDKSIKAIDAAYLQLVEHNVAELILVQNLISKINSINKGEVWKTADSQKRKIFLQNHLNYGNSVNILELING